MVKVEVELHPVSVRVDADGKPEFVALRTADGSPFRRGLSSNLHPLEVARRELATLVGRLLEQREPRPSESTATALQKLLTTHVEVIGADADDDRLVVVCTSIIPLPFADESWDLAAGSLLAWDVLSSGAGKKPGERGAGRSGKPVRRGEVSGLVLDYWRQAFEETDFALDFLPPTFSLLQLRHLYDAVWGYPQDPSGFKRWAVGEADGAFTRLLDPGSDEEETFLASLGRQFSAELAARAGSYSKGPIKEIPAYLRLEIAVAAATSRYKLHPRRGPVSLFTKSAAWRAGPTWIPNLYSPRPNWTRWRLS